jgi:hypothetical protein
VIVRALLVIAGLIIAVLGLAAPPASAAGPIGPVCLGLETFRDSFEIFLLPSGGSNFVLSGHNLSGGGPVVGSGRLDRGEFVFYFLTPALNNPGLVFEGSLNLASSLGTARCFVLDGQFPCGSDILIGLVRCP